jgi:EAL domain-containing protein (putative c-di-GMP-specific phosphodiesterase class I)
VLAAYGCAATGLTLELPESGIDGPASTANIAILRAAGIRVSVVAFGLDLRSLGCLRGIVVDGIRLDPGLVRSCATAPADGAAVRAVLGMARELDLVVAAAGVDDSAQQAVLVGAGCRYLRGTLYGPAQRDAPGAAQPVQEAPSARLGIAS